MKTKLIKTESEYAAALARVDKLMDAKPGTPQGDALEILSLLIHDYEERVFPIAKPDPVAATTAPAAVPLMKLRRDTPEFFGLSPAMLSLLAGSPGTQEKFPRTTLRFSSLRCRRSSPLAGSGRNGVS